MANYTYFAAGRLNTTPLDFNGNAKKILKLSAQAHAKGIKILAFPELCLSGYNCGDLFEHTELLKASVRALLEIKYALPDDLIVGVGLPLLGSNGKIFDAYVLMQKGSIEGVTVAHSFYNSKDSRVRHFNTPTDADVTFTLGSSVFTSQNTFEIDGKFVSILFNEGDVSLLDESDLVICPEVGRYELDSENAKEQKLLDISKSLNCSLISTNLLGCESGSDVFDGLSIVADNGVLIARANTLSFKREDLFTSETGIHNYLCEYDTIVRAVSLGLFDWMLKTYAHGFALSMSGGADSGLCATCVCYGQLAALQELGFDEYKAILEKLKFDVPSMDTDLQSYVKSKIMPQVLTTVYQGSAVSGSITKTAAAKVSENLGATHFEWSIAKLVEDYVGLINDTTPNKPLSWDTDDLTLQNIQARCRAPSIWMMANRYNKLLITTCNASEDAVGYCTMDGDTAGGVAPIGDISKSRILRINQHIADNGIVVEKGKVVLSCPNMSYISAQAPTAELRPGGNQTDERDLMPYVILDRIHVLHQDELYTPQLILDTLDKEYSNFPHEELKTFVVRYFTKFSVNQWKRERGATTFHIEKTDLNAKDGFIFPLLNDGYSSLIEDLK